MRARHTAAHRGAKRGETGFPAAREKVWLHVNASLVPSNIIGDAAVVE
jgi:hypothetical protein